MKGQVNMTGDIFAEPSFMLTMVSAEVSTQVVTHAPHNDFVGKQAYTPMAIYPFKFSFHHRNTPLAAVSASLSNMWQALPC
jgi:hypothetical protein